MSDAYGRIGLVDVLTTRSGSAEGIDTQVGGIEIDVFDLIDFRHDRDGTGRGVDAALGFCFWYALYAMPSRFEFEARIRALTTDTTNYFAIAAELGLTGR